MASTALTKAREQISSLSRRTAQLRGSSHIQAGGHAAIVVASAAGAGALDAKVPEVAGVKPSIALGIVAATAGVFTRSPKLIYGAAGMLAPAAYDAAFDALDDGK